MSKQFITRGNCCLSIGLNKLSILGFYCRLTIRQICDTLSISIDYLSNSTFGKSFRSVSPPCLREISDVGPA